MAIKKTITCPTTGLTITDAYINLGYILDNRDRGRIEVRIYNSQTDYDNGKEPCNYFIEELSSDNYSTYLSENVLSNVDKTIRSQIYVYLKTLDAYSGGVDL